MSPLKAALLWGALNVSPTALEAGAQKAEADEASLNQATEQILEAIEQQLEDQLQNFGPEEVPVAPEEDTTNDFSDFADEAENGIMPTKNESEIPSRPHPTPQEQTPAPPQDSKPGNTPPETENQTADVTQNDQLQGNDGIEDDQNVPPEEDNVQLPEQKGFITQTINSIRYRNQIKALSKKLKDFEKQTRGIQRIINKKTNGLKALNIKKWTLKTSKMAADAGRKSLFVFNCCGGCCILAFLLPATIMIKKVLDTFSFFLARIIKTLDEQINAVKQIINQLQAQLKMIQKKQVEIEQQIYILANQSLFGSSVARDQFHK